MDTSLWKEFRIGGEQGLFKVVKGKRLTKAKMYSGTTNFIGSSAENNGVTNHISNHDNIHHGNLITVAYNGSVGETFYQEEEFIASDDVNVLYPNFEMNKYIALFLCPIIRSVGKKYVFINKWKKEDMERDCIKLPVDIRGNPDWKYMEDYMKKTEISVKKSIQAFENDNTDTKVIDTSKWKKFAISRLFIIKSPATRTIKKYDEGNTPYVSSGGINNGVVSYLQPKKNEQLEEGNCITVSPLDGSSFYQEKNFLGRGGAGSAIALLYNSNLSKYNALFICTVIKKASLKFSYNDALTSDNLRTLMLKLPALQNNDNTYFFDKEKKYSDEGFVPDWQAMEDFMKNIESIAKNKLNSYI